MEICDHGSCNQGMEYPVDAELINIRLGETIGSMRMVDNLHDGFYLLPGIINEVLK
jgi:hypothetical protein